MKYYVDKDTKKETAKKQPQTQEKEGVEEKNADARATQQPSKGASIQSAQQPPDPALFMEHKGNDLWISFLTTGAITVIDREGKEVTQPYVRRVAYILERDPQNPAVLHIMYRYSADATDLKSIRAPKFPHSYELATGIKSFSLDFTVFEKVEPKGEKKGEEKEQKPQPSSLKEWKEPEIWDKYKSLVPAYVTIRGIQTDPTGKTDSPFEFMFKVYAYDQYKPKPPALQTTGNPIEDLDAWMKKNATRFKVPQGGKR